MLKSRHGQRICLFSKSPRVFPGPRKPPIQCTPWYFPGGKQPGKEVGLSKPSSAEVKRIGAILLHLPLRLRDVGKDIFTSFFLIDTHTIKRK